MKTYVYLKIKFFILLYMDLPIKRQIGLQEAGINLFSIFRYFT